MAFWERFWKRRKGANFPPLPQTKVIHLGTFFVDPYHCSATHTGLDTRAIGGAAYSSGVPEPASHNRWKRSLTVPFSDKLQVTASAWEDESGEGSVTWDLSQPRKRKHAVVKPWGNRFRQGIPLASDCCYKLGQPDFLQISNVAPNFNLDIFSNKVFSQRVTVPEKRYGRTSRYNSTHKRKRAKPAQSFRVDLRRDARQQTVGLHKEHAKYGKIAFSLTPAKRFSTSIAIKQAFWKRFWKSRSKPKRRGSHRGERDEPRKMVVKSDVEYRWKENCLSVTARLEAFSTKIRLRTWTNPLQFTPSVQIPLGSTKEAPWINWVREPGSGLGEVHLGRKGFELVTDWPHPTRVSLKQRSTDGSVLRVGLNKKGTFVIDKTIITKPLQGSAVATVNAHMTNMKRGTTLNASLLSSLGVVSASMSASRSFNLVMELNIDRGYRAYTIACQVEEAKRIGVRLGLFL